MLWKYYKKYKSKKKIFFEVYLSKVKGLVKVNQLGVKAWISNKKLLQNIFVTIFIILIIKQTRSTFNIRSKLFSIGTVEKRKIWTKITTLETSVALHLNDPLRRNLLGNSRILPRSNANYR